MRKIVLTVSPNNLIGKIGKIVKRFSFQNEEYVKWLLISQFLFKLGV